LSVKQTKNMLEFCHAVLCCIRCWLSIWWIPWLKANNVPRN
jgi:hypothetical protein